MKAPKPINSGLPKYRAFHIEEPGIASCLITDIGVSMPFVGVPGTPQIGVHSTKALWDTGAESSAINKTLAAAIGLKPIDKMTVTHAGGQSEVDVFLVNLYLPNNFLIPSHRIFECTLPGGKFDLLIGMDIMRFGDLSLSHAGGKTNFSFRMPSIGGLNFLVNKHGGQLDNPKAKA